MAGRAKLKYEGEDQISTDILHGGFPIWPRSKVIPFRFNPRLIAAEKLGLITCAEAEGVNNDLLRVTSAPPYTLKTGSAIGRPTNGTNEIQTKRFERK